MKNILLLLSTALTLVACAPALQAVQPNERATLTRDGQSLVLTNPGPDALTGDPTAPSDGVALTIDGSDALLLDAQGQKWCTVEKKSFGSRWSCKLPTIAPNTRLRVAWLGGTVNDAAGLAYRPSSDATQIVIWLK
ncbi:hypothetical protein [Deinococcus sp. QL22]|uniref:hypothetical protein n=1 Tax=Deinococcus sp. QL22 TaxID=2939437 RepID=UPI0020180D8C|nr:hypothetical protein [Deinococcus sp. QL22]UQN05426.1 hypothetical protein M1R55_11130 [Deinococcus sp. QL22]